MPDPRPTRQRPRRVGGDGDPLDVEVHCADEQADVALDLARWRGLALDVVRAEGVRGDAQLGLTFVGEHAMAELNAAHMGHEGPTDVLAFPVDVVDTTRTPGPATHSRAPEPGRTDESDHTLLLGDVVVCPAVARAQAPSHAGTVDDEIALLVVHGILHVLGHDHDAEASAARMHARERALLEAHHWRGPAPAHFRHVPRES
ncbi:MAG: rRNA maturation RNase YbeY [Acidimicrobiia bacterium]